MGDDNIAVVRRFFEEVWNERRVEAIDELLVPESICHDASGSIVGPQGFKDRQYLPFLDAFPDFRVSLEAVVAQGDQVVVRWNVTATHTGEGLGFKATGESVGFQGITWVRVHEGKMMEGWQFSNIAEIIRGLAERTPA